MRISFGPRRRQASLSAWETPVDLGPQQAFGTPRSRLESIPERDTASGDGLFGRAPLAVAKTATRAMQSGQQVTFSRASDGRSRMKRRLESLNLLGPAQAANLRLPPDACHLTVEETSPVAAPRAAGAHLAHELRPQAE